MCLNCKNKYSIAREREREHQNVNCLTDLSMFKEQKNIYQVDLGCLQCKSQTG